ncbi:MAG: M20/M25/M40 family metallo-hydrolase [Nitrososphaerota archaeon]|nr:M20/M25/M40 family metallo-hydrolase [Nitrososphaerota archaeon]MDG6940366.1 M20/M25/M40 family metallo-hydrolase [Nitrososphaerota archaeon]
MTGLLSDSQKNEAERLLLDLVSVPSPSGKEGAVAEVIRSWMAGHGYSDVKTDAAGNVWGFVGKGRPTVLFCGHMDTVPGEVPVKVQDGKVHGRGASDAKGPLAAMLMACHLLRDPGLTIMVLAVVGEESDGRGLKHAMAHGLEADRAVFGEPSGHRNIVIGYRGRVQATVHFDCDSFHASSPWTGKSAVQFALDFITRLSAVDTSAQTQEKFGSTSVCVTRLCGGESGNVAPAHAELTVDIRFPPARTPASIAEELKVVAASMPPEVKTKVWVDEPMNAAESDQKGPLVKAFRRAVFAASGSPAKCVRKTGSGDMNYLIAEKGIDAVTFGPGDTSVSHTQRESISLDDYFAAIEVLAKLPEELLKVDGSEGKKEI